MTSPLKDKYGHSLSWSKANTKVINRVKNYLLDFKLAWLWCLGHVPLHSFRRFVFTLAGVTIGRGSTIHIGARFYQPGNIRIGDDTIVGDHVTLDGRARLTIGHHVDIASEVMIFNSQHDINHPEFIAIEAPVTIADYCFIGPRAIILPGVSLGKGAVVAAGAVVTKNVDPGIVVGGIPAKAIAKRTLSDYHYILGRYRLFQ